MKLGTETGSLTNHLYSRAVIGQPEPVIGMGATVLYWTDRHAGTIVMVYNGPKGEIINIQEDFAKRADTNGMSESQSYDYSPNVNGVIRSFRKGKNGGWQYVVKNPKTGRWNKEQGPCLRIGERCHYHDFSF